MSELATGTGARSICPWTTKEIWSSSASSTGSWQDVAAVLATPEGQSRRRLNISVNEGLAKSLRSEADDRTPEVLPKKTVAMSLELLTRAQRTIPGASQTFSKQYTAFVRGVN